MTIKQQRIQSQYYGNFTIMKAEVLGETTVTIELDQATATRLTEDLTTFLNTHIDREPKITFTATTGLEMVPGAKYGPEIQVTSYKLTYHGIKSRNRSRWSRIVHYFTFNQAKRIPEQIIDLITSYNGDHQP